MSVSNFIAGGLRKAEIKIAFVYAVTRGEADHGRAEECSHNRQGGQQKESLREF
jgi:hypothetical protein